MGAVTFSIDRGLVAALTEVLPLQAFVETGTFHGDSVALVKDLFPQVYSVELSPELYERACGRFADEPHIQLRCGSSVDALKAWRARLQHTASLYFLDAHWCCNSAGEERGEGSGAAECEHLSQQCPLLEELNAIGPLGESSVIVIDDARLFLAPPPAPHATPEWPDLNTVLTALRACITSHQLMVLNDCIIAYPHAAADALRAYAQQANTDLLAVMSKVSDYDNLSHQFEQAVTQLADKEQMIQTLAQACEQREALLQAAHKDASDARARSAADATTITTQFDARLAGLEQANAALMSQLSTLHDGLRPSATSAEPLLATSTVPFEGATLGLLQEICDARLKVIQEQHAALTAFRRASISYRVKQLFSLYPKLGKLVHHPPIPIQGWGGPPATPAERLKSWPRIAIVTPSYGQAAFIARTLDSVLDQNYPNLAYYVQDGGSSDGTTDILSAYADRLSGWRSAPDEGQSHAINLGFAQVEGDIMAWLNSDDLLLPGTLAYVADYFARHPEVDVVYGHRILIDEQDREIGRWILPRHDAAALLWADFIPQETLFWRRAIWDKVGGTIDESFRFAMDWDLLLRFRKAGARMHRLPHFLGAFRIHEAQKTSAAIHEVGLQEMDRLRQRELGRSPTRQEIHKALVPYLVRHVLADVGWRIRYRLGVK